MTKNEAERLSIGCPVLSRVPQVRATDVTRLRYPRVRRNLRRMGRLLTRLGERRTRRRRRRLERREQHRLRAQASRAKDGKHLAPWGRTPGGGNGGGVG